MVLKTIAMGCAVWASLMLFLKYVAHDVCFYHMMFFVNDSIFEFYVLFNIQDRFGRGLQYYQLWELKPHRGDSL